MATQEQRPLPYRTYADKIERDYPGKAYSWFVQMMREGYHQGNPGRDCTIYVVDQEADQSIEKSFETPSHSDLNTDFKETLEKPLSENGIRFVVIAYRDLYSLNFSYVDHIALNLDLEPAFLFAHFERVRGKSEPFFRKRAPALRPLDTQHLEFTFPGGRYSWYGDMAVTRSVPSATHCRTSELH